MVINQCVGYSLSVMKIKYNECICVWEFAIEQESFINFHYVILYFCIFSYAVKLDEYVMYYVVSVHCLSLAFWRGMHFKRMVKALNETKLLKKKTCSKGWRFEKKRRRRMRKRISNGEQNQLKILIMKLYEWNENILHLMWLNIMQEMLIYLLYTKVKHGNWIKKDGMNGCYWHLLKNP